MEDFRIAGLGSLPLDKAGEGRKAAADPLGGFKKVLGQSIGEVNGLLQASNQSVEGMVAGKLDVHQAMVAMEQAGISFRLMVQVRNKMMAAYEEIMRMQL